MLLGQSLNYVEVGTLDSQTAKLLAVEAGPIWLHDGFEGPKGYGRLHVECNKSRMKLFENIGFNSFESFVRIVATSWIRIISSDLGRIGLVCTRQGYELVVIIQHQKVPEGHWSVVTGIPKRVERGAVLLVR